MIELKFNEQEKVPFQCLSAGCEKPITAAKAKVEGEVMAFSCTCAGGHVSVFTYNETERHAVAALRPRARTIRTKVSGVTFSNPDGVSRQELLKRLQAGDALQITKGTIENTTAYLVRHAIGIIGTVKGDIIRSFEADTGCTTIEAKVVQITGGQGEKATYGCNIELTTTGCQPAGEAPPAPTPAEATGRKVYMDPDGKNIFHTDPRCSGMKGAKEVTLAHARDGLRARPCKKCAGGV